MSAIEGISGAVASFQSTSVPKVEPVKAEETKVSADIPETDVAIAKEVVTVTTADGASSDGSTSDKQENKEPSPEQMKKAVEDLNKRMNRTSCEFSVHEATNRIMIKIVDKETKEVVKEVPPEKTLDLIEKAWEMAGILVDEKL